LPEKADPNSCCSMIDDLVGAGRCGLGGLRLGGGDEKGRWCCWANRGPTRRMRCGDGDGDESDVVDGRFRRLLLFVIFWWFVVGRVEGGEVVGAVGRARVVFVC